MAIISKKCWPEHFEKILSGEKTFEVRLNNFECSLNDLLILCEWNPETKEFTGRKLSRRITSILNTNNLPFWSRAEIQKYGLLILSISKEGRAMKCPVCGAEVNTGSYRYATITPARINPSYEEHFYIQIYYCTKDDSHTFGILTRVKEG